MNADDVARRMGTSHIPVREALRALDTDGWVIHRPHQGASVRTRESSELIDLFEARALIEPPTVALAAERRTSADLDRLDSIISAQEATRDSATLARVNYDFHVAMAAAAHNATLLATITSLSKRVRFYFLPTVASRRDDSLAEHRMLLTFLRQRNGASARELARHHITTTRADAVTAIETGLVKPAFHEFGRA